MKPEVPLTAGQLLDAARGHGLAAGSVVKVPSPGIINTIYVLDDLFVVRVPRDDEGHFEQLRREASVIPALVAAGVSTPGVIAFDDSCVSLPVPFMVVERAVGIDAESAGVYPPDPPATWRRLGRELAITHETVPPSEVIGDVNSSESADIHDLVDRRASDGWFSVFEATRLHKWLSRLAGAGSEVEDQVLVHGDAQMSNVLVDPTSGAFSSLIDWGCAHVGARAIDFRVVPLAAVGSMLDGYREMNGHAKEALEADILLAKLRLIAQALPGGANPGCTWGERPIAWLTDLTLSLGASAESRWLGLLP